MTAGKLSTGPKLRGLDLTSATADTIKQLRESGQLAELEWVRYDHGQSDIIASNNRLKRLSLAYNHSSRTGEWESSNPDDCVLDTSRISSDIENLNLSNNQLTVAPPLHRFHQLTVLNLANNGFERLPDDIFQHSPRLQVLLLSGSKLECLPRSMECLHHLIMLDLSGNQLQSLDHLPPRLPQLNHLSIGNNPFKDGSALDILRGCPLLTLLDASGIDNLWLGQTSSLFRCTPQLTSLNLSFTRMRYLPVSLTECPELRRLDLGGNQLSQLTGFIFKTSRYPLKLKTLILARNERLNIELVVAGNCLKHFRQMELLDIRGCLGVSVDSRRSLRAALPALGQLLFDDPVIMEVDSSPVSKPKASESADNNGPLLEYYAKYGSELRRQAKLQQQQIPACVDWQLIYNDPRRSRTALSVKELVESFYSCQHKKQKQQQIANNTPTRENYSVQDATIATPPVRSAQQQSIQQGSTVFPRDIGILPGVEVFGIKGYRPYRIADNSSRFKFSQRESYIILSTLNDTANSHELYCWIGGKSAIKKRACAALHAMNLKRHLSDGSVLRSQRIAAGEEPPEFLRLFNDNNQRFEIVFDDDSLSTEDFDEAVDVDVEDGDRSIADHHAVYQSVQKIRLFLVSTSAGGSLLRQLPPYRQTVQQLISADCSDGILCITDSEVIAWTSQKSSLNIRAKTRLHANEFQKSTSVDGNERSKQLHVCHLPPDELNRLLDALPDSLLTHNTVSLDYQNYPAEPTLYKVMIDDEFVDLPQARSSPLIPLTMDLLADSTALYILDCFTEIFVWRGRKSNSAHREIALQIAETTVRALQPARPSWAAVTLVRQDFEDYWFQSQFRHQPRRIQKNVNSHSEEIERHKAVEEDSFDIQALFRESTGDGLCNYSGLRQFADILLDDMQSILCFEKQGKRFKLVPTSGRLHQDASLVIVLTYKTAKPVIYFWQGDKCSPIDRLLFEFSFRDELEALIESQTNQRPLVFSPIRQFWEPLELRLAFEGRLLINLLRSNITEPLGRDLYHIFGDLILVDSITIQADKTNGSLVCPKDNDGYATLTISNCSRSDESNSAAVIHTLVNELFPECKAHITNDMECGPITHDDNTEGRALRVFECSATTGKLTAREMFGPISKTHYQRHPESAYILLNHQRQFHIFRGAQCTESVYRFAKECVMILKR